ncbi:MAG: radical SAM protein [Methanoregulaceae archaeon]|nr:radical SAM protein [Methanoregulaceae archaeon]
MSRKALNVPFSVLKKSALAQKYVMNSSRFGMPSFVQIEVTTKCNIKCPLCLRTIDPARIIDADMSLDVFKTLINQLKGRTGSISLVGLGEPLLNPEIFSMISFAKKNGLEVSLIDNFTLIDREKSLALIDSELDFLYVSFDNVSKEDFEKRRTGASFENVVENIRLFIKTRNEIQTKQPVFLFKSTISQNNFAEIPKLVKFAEDLGADGINFGKMMDEDESRMVTPPPLTEKDLPESKIAIDPCELSESYVCDATRGCYVTFDGKVLPCGLMAESVSRAHYPKLQLGDLQSDKLSDIWRSSRFKQLRKNIESGKYLPECATCGGCKKPPKNLNPKSHCT